jgi:signal transduction histidine kinase
MIPAAKPANEAERIASLNEYKLLDTLAEDAYDDITKIAADICGTPISLISIIDSDRQWFKSRVGLDAPETHRDLAFCAHAILNPEDIFIVKDPATDKRFHDNPLVTGIPHIAFYAGIPLVTESGNALGTLCVLDNKPNDLTKEQKTTLRALARQVVAQLEIRKKNIQLNNQKAQLEKTNQDLSRFAYVVAHDIKSPCCSLAMGVAYLKSAYGTEIGDDGRTYLDLMETTALAAITMVNGILEHTQAINKVEVIKERFTFGSIFEDLKSLITVPDGFSFEAINTNLELFTSRSLLLQILLNLCNNAIKYNDKTQGLVLLSGTDIGNIYSFSVKDNGPGIDQANQKRIFELFSTLGVNDRFNNKGTGIGLATVKRLVEKMDGHIEVISTNGMGSSFDFTLSK